MTPNAGFGSKGSAVADQDGDRAIFLGAAFGKRKVEEYGGFFFGVLGRRKLIFEAVAKT